MGIVLIHNSKLDIIKLRYKGHGRYLEYTDVMVHVCCVPACSSRSNREVNLSYFRLPLHNKRLLKQWIHCIGHSNLPLNASTRVCSCHFISAEGQKLRKDEVPLETLPILELYIVFGGNN